MAGVTHPFIWVVMLVKNTLVGCLLSRSWVQVECLRHCILDKLEDDGLLIPLQQVTLLMVYEVASDPAILCYLIDYLMLS